MMLLPGRALLPLSATHVRFTGSCMWLPCTEGSRPSGVRGWQLARQPASRSWSPRSVTAAVLRWRVPHLAPHPVHSGLSIQVLIGGATRVEFDGTQKAKSGKSDSPLTQQAPLVPVAASREHLRESCWSSLGQPGTRALGDEPSSASEEPTRVRLVQRGLAHEPGDSDSLVLPLKILPPFFERVLLSRLGLRVFPLTDCGFIAVKQTDLRCFCFSPWRPSGRSVLRVRCDPVVLRVSCAGAGVHRLADGPCRRICGHLPLP